MKIIHTSDWHLGKHLNGFSRIDEQKKFIDDFIDILEKEDIDVVVIAGDIYDVTTPSIEAEQLFYNSMKRITRNGKTIVVVSAGNHDSAERISASKIWGKELGVIITSTINDFVIDAKINNFTIKHIMDGVFSIEKNNEKITFMNLAYPSETRVNQKIEAKEDKDFGEQYKELIKEIIKKREVYFVKDSYNIVIGHFLMFGATRSDSEKEINIGGLDSLNSDILPESADYIALGHLHNLQKISGHKNCYYSGSPLQYSRSEKDKLKYVNLIDTVSNEVTSIKLNIYKQIEVLVTENLDNTISYIENQVEDKWYYIEIDQINIETSKIQALRNASNSIVEIIPIQKKIMKEELFISENRVEKSIIENFIDYYKYEKSIEPSSEILKLFRELIGEQL